MHLKKVHNLATEKSKPDYPLTRLEGLQQQNHIAMNTKVFIDPITVV
jgi:hypothetical protein